MDGYTQYSNENLNRRAVVQFGARMLSLGFAQGVFNKNKWGILNSYILFTQILLAANIDNQSLFHNRGHVPLKLIKYFLCYQVSHLRGGRTSLLMEVIVQLAWLAPEPASMQKQGQVHHLCCSWEHQLCWDQSWKSLFSIAMCRSSERKNKRLKNIVMQVKYLGWHHGLKKSSHKN